MIAFLAPLALLGLALLGIPVVLHLFKPRKVREIPFSSLRWLRDSTQRLSKRFQWHQILLFLLRVGFIVSLTLAVARPVFSRREAGRFRERFVVLDLGRGMDYAEPGRSTPLEAGRRIALDALESGAPGDRITVVPGDSTPTAFGPLIEDGEVYGAGVRQALPGQFPGRVSATFDEIARLLDPEREDAQLDISVITDFRHSGWDYGDVAEFRRQVGERSVNLTVVDVGPAAPVNAWIAGARLIEDRDGRRFIRASVGLAGSEHEERRLRLTGLPGLPDQVEEIALRADRRQTIDLPLPVAYATDRAVARLQLEPPDAMPGDDVYWLNLDQRASLQVLVVEPRSTAVETMQSGFHLRTALAAIAETGNHAMHILRHTPDTLQVDDVTGAHALILVDVPSLSPALASVIDQQVRAGAGLAVFLGPSVQPDFYNTHWVAADGGGLLPAPLGEPMRFDHDERTPARLTSLHAGHPLLRGLVDPQVGDLGQVAVRAAFDIPLSTAERARTAVPASIGAQTPAILVHPAGAGQIVLFNLSADDRWSNLPRLPVFVPVIDRLLTFLTGGLARRTFTAGETVLIPAPDQWAGEQLEITAPDGLQLTPHRRLMGGRHVLQLEAPRQIGVYRIHPADSAPAEHGIPFVVQASRADSLPRRMDEEVLRGWWPDARIRVVRPDPETGQVADMAVRRARSLVPWLVALAALFLIAETFFVHWFCPRLGIAWKTIEKP